MHSIGKRVVNISLCSVLAVLIVFLAGQQAARARGDDSSSSAKRSVSADMKVHSRSNNAGKRLAVASPIIEPIEPPSHKLSVQAMLDGTRSKLTRELKARNIELSLPEVQLPEDWQETCDTIYTQGQRAFVFAHEHTMEFSQWFARYLKQLTGPPQMTPVGSPYAVEDHVLPADLTMKQSAINSSRLYLTDRGRLRTVVDQ